MTPLRHRRSPAGQEGFALIWILSVLLVASIGVVSLATEWSDLNIDRQTDKAQDRALTEARKRLSDWYVARPRQSEPANVDNAVAIEDLRRMAQLDSIRPGVRLARAPLRFSAQGVAYSRFLLWIPSGVAVDATGWNDTTAAWNIPSDVRAIEFTGLDIQSARYAESVRRTQALAQRLESWYAWQVTLDPSHEMGRNYFRARNCAAPASNELGCYGVNDAVGSTDLGTRIGVTASSYTDAWGREIEIDNVPPPMGGGLPPFAVKVRFVPPGSDDRDETGANRNLTFPVVVTAIQRVS